MKKLRLLVVDNCPLIRLGLTTVFSATPDLEVVGEAATAHEALHQTRRLRPDVVVMDADLPDWDSIRTCAEIRCQQAGVQVLLLTHHWSQSLAKEAYCAGASGYISTYLTTDDLIATVRAVSKTAGQ